MKKNYFIFILLTQVLIGCQEKKLIHYPMWYLEGETISEESISSIPDTIQFKLKNHLMAYLGTNYQNYLKFSGGQIIFDSLKNPKSYMIHYSFSNLNQDIDKYFASIIVDKNGVIIQEIDLPNYTKFQNKKQLISLKDAFKKVSELGLNLSIREFAVRLAFDTLDKSIYYNFISKQKNPEAIQIDVNAHTGKIISYKPAYILD